MIRDEGGNMVSLVKLRRLCREMKLVTKQTSYLQEYGFASLKENVLRDGVSFFLY